jgi:hypothetical protein
MRQHLHLLTGLAVEAGEVAPVGNRDSQVVNAPVVGVLKQHTETLPQLRRFYKPKLSCNYGLDRPSIYQYNLIILNAGADCRDISSAV